MHECRDEQDWGRLQEMRGRIVEIERLVLELKELGQGAPVVEQNVRAILSLVHVLKFGISDLAESIEKEGE